MITYKNFCLISFWAFFLLLIFSCNNNLNDSTNNNPPLPDPVDPGASGNPDSSPKILFIGNSLTYYNDQPEMFFHLSDEMGKQIYVDQATIPDAQLGDHITSNFTKEKILDKKWDIVVLQGAVLGIGFPDYQKSIMQNIEIMKQLILDNNSETEIYYFMPWSLKDGMRIDFTQYNFSELQKLICAGTATVASQMDIMVAPVGWAWYKVTQEKPDIELFMADGMHPTLEGSYLSACVYYVSMFQDSLLDNTYTADIDQNIAHYLQETATKTVMDSLEYWNILPK